jgi:hypothetical protein
MWANASQEGARRDADSEGEKAEDGAHQRRVVENGNVGERTGLRRNGLVPPGVRRAQGRTEPCDDHRHHRDVHRKPASPADPLGPNPLPGPAFELGTDHGRSQDHAESAGYHGQHVVGVLWQAEILGKEDLAASRA